ncbi:MAG: pyrroline-5-carboxylate reductase [Betaproteobacteria bacterium]|nr:pyrroline-5-carboxylate reductase [Betaproteobacteria bacterium]
MKIASIGGGNMAQAILGGLTQKGQPAGDCFAVEPNGETREKLAAMGIAATPAFDARVLEADVVLVAVKPQQTEEALRPLSGKLASQLVVSIAAGIRSDDLSRWLGNHTAIVRAMPNTPALILAGITGLYARPGVDAAARARAEQMMQAVGKTVWFDQESQLDTVTAVSGSGPAYVFYFIEALERAALELGFPEATARQFALETFLGAAKLAAAGDIPPGQLRANVTSKRGTTESAIAVFDRAGMQKTFIDGVRAAEARAAEMGRELGGSK